MKIKAILTLSSLMILLASCGGAPSDSSNSEISLSTSATVQNVIVSFYADPSETGTIYNTQNVKTGDLLVKPTDPTSSDPAFDVFKGWSVVAFATSENEYWNFSTSTIPEGISKLSLYGQWTSSGDSSTSEIPPIGEKKTIYLNPDIWNADSPKYYAWIWGGSDDGSWIDFTSEGTLYKIEIAETYTNIIFLRAGQSMEHGWTPNTNYWNKTGDETLDFSKTVFKVTAWSGGGSEGKDSIGTWSAKS